MISNNTRRKIRLFDMVYGLGRFEQFMAKRWLNPFQTVYVNMRCFPLKQAIRMPFWVYGRAKIICLSGSMIAKDKCYSGMIRFNKDHINAPSMSSCRSELNIRGNIVFGGNCYIGTGTKICVGLDKTLELGNDITIADFVNIGVFTGVKIGSLCRIAHRSQILDSNYHYIANFNKRVVPNRTKGIEIGNGCWICNTTTITGGAKLPDFTIVSSNSLVNKDFSNEPNNSIVGGIPAKPLSTGFRRIENPRIEAMVVSHYEKYDSLFILPEETLIEQCTKD